MIDRLNIEKRIQNLLYHEKDLESLEFQDSNLFKMRIGQNKIFYSKNNLTPLEIMTDGLIRRFQIFLKDGY